MMAGRQTIQKFVTSLPLGALATVTAVIGGSQVDSSRLNGIRIIDMWLNVTWHAKTDTEGPITYGIGRDLESVTLLKGALEADPQGFADKDENEKLTRNVMVLGVIPTAGVAQQPSAFTGMRRIKFPWKEINEGSDLQVWAFNRDVNTLTTGTIIDFEFVINGEWLRD